MHDKIVVGTYNKLWHIIGTLYITCTLLISFCLRVSCWCAAQLRLSINSVQTKSTGNVHYDITVYYKPRKYLLIYLLVKLTYTNLLIKNNKCYYLQFWCPLYRTHWKISEMSFSLYYKIWRHMLQNDALS